MGSAPEPADVRTNLWTGGDPEVSVGGSDRLLEQYKLYVEMADRISARRGLTNTFFLTLNTAIFAFVGGAGRSGLPSGAWVVVPVLALIVECAAWFLLLRSYRQLNAAKYVVVGAMEERLPASPYYRAEWTALGEGKDRSLYWPLSHLEQWVPVGFGILYVAGGLALALL